MISLFGSKASMILFIWYSNNVQKPKKSIKKYKINKNKNKCIKEG